MAEIGTDIAKATCCACRSQLSLDGDGNASLRLEALFVLSITQSSPGVSGSSSAATPS